MRAERCYQVDGYRCRVVLGAGPERDRAEAEVIRAGWPLPLAHRSAWAAMREPARSWFFSLQDRGGEIAGGFAAEVNRSRALPGHLLMRVERFGSGLDPSAVAPALRALARAARENHRVLRVSVEAFSEDAAVRERIGLTLDELGFAPVADTRRYPRTVAVDLSGGEADIFARLHGTARRHVRAVAKNPVQVRDISDTSLVPRMAELMDETMARTGGSRRHYDWPRRIAFTNANPGMAKLLGLFRTDATGPGALLAFAWGCMNGDYAHYDAAASTRHTDLKLPLNYAIAWELIAWAKRNGATWFDFGGVTRGSHGDGRDALGGISDFKRYFGKDEIEVGGEWYLEPRGARVRLADALSGAATWLRSLQQRRALARALPGAGVGHA